MLLYLKLNKLPIYILKKQKQNQKQRSMSQVNNSDTFTKYKTYFLTFFAYVTIHTMRMSYSFAKPYFEKTYKLDPLFLGLFDGLVYISLGIGFFCRFLFQGNMEKTRAFLIFGAIASVAYSVIPILSLNISEINGAISSDQFVVQYAIPGIALIFFGFCQFSAWPVLLYLVNQHFDVKRQGTILGIWSANGDIGNITGFLLSKLIIQNFELRWQFAMIIAASANLFLAILVFFFVQDKQKKIKQHILLESEENSEINQQIMSENKTRKEIFKEFLQYVKEIGKLNENKLYFMAMGLLKSILYGFLLWIPTFLNHNDMKDISAYLPILFNIATVFGSALLGYFYQDATKKPIYEELSCCGKTLYLIKRNLKSYSLFYSCIIICTLFGFFYIIQKNQTLYLIIAGAIGFFLGGAFNMLASNEVIALTHGDQKKVDMLSTISMSFGNITVGIVQIIIGLVLNVKKNPQQQKNLFIVLLGVGGISVVILFIRSTIIFKRRREESIILRDQRQDLDENSEK